MKIAALENPKSRQEELGQFLTATPVADFIASMFGALPKTVRLLDAGAGSSSLTAAFVSRLCEKNEGVRAIDATLYELDPQILDTLSATMRECQRRCTEVGFRFTFTIRDDAVKFFVEEGLLIRNPGNPSRPTNSGKTVYQIEPTALAPGGAVLYFGDTENKFVHLEATGLAALGVTLDSAAKVPDVIVHHTAKNWILLIEAVTSAGPLDGKLRKELNDLFAGCKASLVFVAAFENRRTMQTFVSHISWESEGWIAEDPNHMIHFNGERFLGPYPDVMPTHQ